MIKTVKKTVVIGSGIMGSGIAAILASKGIKTLLLDIIPPDLDKNEKNPLKRNQIVLENLQKAKKIKPPVFTSKEDANFIEIGNLEDDFDKIADCDWVFEVAIENVKIKKELFSKIDKIRKEGTFVSTNTSGIPLKLLSEGLSDDFKKHFFGTHFFNPVRYMHLLEIIKGKDTLDEVIEFATNFGEEYLGKGIVNAKDTPNFIANRLGVQSISKAIQFMVKHKLNISEVDLVASRFLGRAKSGILRTSDIVGIDTLVYVLENTIKMLPEEKDDFILPDFVSKMIENNLLGNKTKAGFYKKEKDTQGKKVIKALDYDTLEYKAYDEPFYLSFFAAKEAKGVNGKIKAICAGDDAASHFAWDLVTSEVIYAAEKIPEISDTIVEMDRAMKWGYNLQVGPFESWDALGVEESVARMEKEGKKVPEKVKTMLQKGVKSFYKQEGGDSFYYDFKTEQYQKIVQKENEISLFNLKNNSKIAKSCRSASLIDLDDGIFCFEFHTKMNSLNGEIIGFINEVIEYIEANGQGLVIGNENFGTPGAFSAGADIFFVMNAIKDKKFKDIEEFLKVGQGTIQKLKYSNFPIVAAPFDLALGGGCEICIGTADKIVAHKELYMGLVEVGVGLIPAGGGCLNLWKKFLNGVPDAAIQNNFDFGKLFIPVFMNIGTAKVSSSAKDAMSLGFLNSNDRIVANKYHLIAEAKKEALHLANCGYVPPVKKKLPVMGESGFAMVNAELFNRLEGSFLSEHDAKIAKKAAFVISGGNVKEGSLVDEETILTLEREAFLELCNEPKTFERIAYTLKTGRPLRN